VPESLRDPSVGDAMLAFLALTQDEPPELALEYLRTAHARLDKAIAACRDASGKLALPAEAERDLSDLKLVLVGLALAADPDVKTPVNLRLVRRKGRPKRNIVRVNDYRRAAHQLLARKPDGYDAAAVEIARETGLDKTEIEAWASHIEGQLAALAQNKKIGRFFPSR
jgi:hypothetical protein